MQHECKITVIDKKCFTDYHMQAVGGVDAMIDHDCKDKDLLALVTYISADERAEKVMENQSVIRQPIVRNGRQATVGYAPEVWKTWQ